MIARALLLACLALPAAAQEAPAPPDGVLKIGRGGSGCTAFLVAPHAAMTAAHCVGGTPVELLAGWEGGRVRQSRPGTDPTRPALEPRMANRYHADQVRLALPRPFSGLAPLAPGPAPRPGTRVEVPAYPKGAKARQTATCIVTERPGTEIVLDCPARAGMSGAPILQGGRVVGILTNRIGRDASFGTALAPDLLD